MASCGLALAAPQGASLSGEEQTEPTQACSATEPKPGLHERGADGDCVARSPSSLRRLLQPRPRPPRRTAQAGSQACSGLVPLPLDMTSPRRRALVCERGSVTASLTESPSSGTNDEVQENTWRRAKYFESHAAGFAWRRAPRSRRGSVQGRLLPGCRRPAPTPHGRCRSKLQLPPHHQHLRHCTRVPQLGALFVYLLVFKGRKKSRRG